MKFQIDFTFKTGIASSLDWRPDALFVAISFLIETVDLEKGRRRKKNIFDFSFDLGRTKRRVTPATDQKAMH